MNAKFLKRRGVRFIAGVIVFICIGAASYAAVRIFYPNPTEWIANWLKNPTCALPCWEKIIPGETSRDQAKSLLSSNPKITGIDERDVIPYGLMLFVKIYNRKYDGNISIRFDDQNIAQEIELITFGGNLYLNDIVSVYGAPKQVLIRNSPVNESVLVDMFYPESGMVIEFFIHNLGGEIPHVKIEKSSEVRNIYLDAPGLKYYLHFSEITDGAVDPRLLSEWKGYTTYP